MASWLSTKIQIGFLDEEEIPVGDELIEAFCQIDPTRQVFRYSEDTKGNPP